MPLPKYCSVAATLKGPGWDRASPPRDLSFTCPLALRAPWLPGHRALPRYSCLPCLHMSVPARQGLGWLGRAGEAADTWVLARREPDGFYYRAQIKAAPELERRGILLVEFEAPPVLGPKLPSQRQCVVLEEDVVQRSLSMDCSLRPGDKVLAPWEPDQQRYGPGTVLWDLQTGDPHRASKEKEISVHFWNGKTAKVPPSGVRWVPPDVWMRAVERLQEPGTREHRSPLLQAACCCLLGPAPGCITNRPPLAPFLCPPRHPQACCLCCCSLMGPTWWPLTGISEAAATELPDSELKPTAQLLPLEAPKEEAEAVPAASAVSSFCDEDWEGELELGLPQRLMVDCAVNTDLILLETSPRPSRPCQLPWRYWRRNGPEPHPGKTGTRCCSTWKEKDNKQQRVQTAVVGTTKELAPKTTKEVKA